MSSLKSGGKKNMKRRKVQVQESKESISHDSDSSKREEIVAPFHSPVDFQEKALQMPAKKWVNACASFSKHLEESTSDIRESVAADFCAQCVASAEYVSTTATNAIDRSRYALREYSRRYLQALRDINSERKDKEELATKSLAVAEELERRIREVTEEKMKAEEEMKRIGEEKREAESERDRLRAALTLREEEERERKRRTPSPPGHRDGGGGDERGDSLPTPERRLDPGYPRGIRGLIGGEVEPAGFPVDSTPC